MARLRVGVVQVRNIVVAWIVEQDESLRAGVSGDSDIHYDQDGFTVKSGNAPALQPHRLYLRGEFRDRDDVAVACTFGSRGGAAALVENIRNAVKAINAESDVTPVTVADVHAEIIGR